MKERTNIGAARRALGVSLAWAVTLSLCHPTASRAQTHEPERRVVVRGRVVDDVTHLGIPDAFVSIATNTTILAGGVADSAGYFQLQVAPRGSLSINVRRLGYQPTSERVIVEDLSSPRTVAMHAVAQKLDEVAVVGTSWRSSRLAGFDERARVSAGGTYFRQETIEALNPRRVTDLMRRVTGIALWDSGGTVLAVTRRGYKPDRSGSVTNNCVMRVGVDGHIKEWGFPIDLIEPQAIHGIEIYKGPATIPTEFNGLRTDTYCGLIMLWTRSGQ